jgi:prophage tail gpP-like protein
MSVDLRFKVNGQIFSGWTRARLSRGIESLCGDFRLEATDRWLATQSAWVIEEEDACEVCIGNTTLLTGFVDKRGFELSDNSHLLSYEGRDQAGALVDCDAVLSAWEFLNKDVVQFCVDVAAQYSIKCTLQPGLTASLIPKAEKLTIDPGDTAFEAMEKACRTAQLLPVSDGLGGVMLCRAGSAKATTTLSTGNNIKRITVDHDGTQKFRTYRVLGQHSAKDPTSGSFAAHVKGEAYDGTVKRDNRIKIVRPEKEVNPTQAVARAQWEATVRMARAHVVTVTTPGWLQNDGTIWPLNALVNVDAHEVGIRGSLLISQAEHTLDSQSGASTTLTLKFPEAYKPKPVIVADTFFWPEWNKGGK